MELADISLEKYIKTRPNAPLDEKLDLFSQILDAFECIHKFKIVHRDIKPANILIKDNFIRVSDFGINYRESDQRITPTGEVTGPRFFLCPEAEDGRIEEPDEKCDIYSLGKLLYYLLSNGKRFAREKFEEREFNLTNIHNDFRFNKFIPLFRKTINRDLSKKYNSIPELRNRFEKCIEQFYFTSEKIERIAQLFNDITSESSGDLEYKIIAKPINLENELFNKEDYLGLHKVLKNSIMGLISSPNFKEVFDHLQLEGTEGIYSRIHYSKVTNPTGGNIFIANEGFVILNCYYNVHLDHLQKKLPIDFYGEYSKRFFELLKVLYNRFQYQDDLLIYFYTDGLKRWKLHLDNDELSYRDSGDPLELNFECSITDLDSQSDIWDLIKNNIIKEIFLSYGYTED